MNKMKQKKKFFHRLLDVIIGVLCVLIVGSGAFAVSMFNENFGYSYDSDAFYWRLEDENFSQMVEMCYANEAAGVEADEELEQYYGVARYFEAASYYKMYQDADDSEQMNKYLERMENAKTLMGELSFLSEKIHEKLDIEM